MNRFRLIDEVSIYLHDRNNCHITLFFRLKRCLYFLQGRMVSATPYAELPNSPKLSHDDNFGVGKTCSHKAESILLSLFFFPSFSLPSYNANYSILLLS